MAADVVGGARSGFAPDADVVGNMGQPAPTGDPDGEKDAAAGAERRRVAALHRYRVLDRDVDPELQALVRLATIITGIPMGAVNLVDAHRQWQAATVGVARTEVPREHSFCSVAITEDGPVVVADARRDPRFAASPFTTGELASLRTYAAAPLLDADGYALGTLCVFDEEIHEVTDGHVEALGLLARQAMALLEARRRAALLAEAEERFRLAFANAPVGMSLVGLDGRFLQVNEALARIVGRRGEEFAGVSVADVTPHAEDLARDTAAMADVLGGKEASYRLEKRYRHRDGHDVWVELWGAVVRDVDGVPQYFIKQAEDISARKAAEHALLHQATHDPLTGLPNRLLVEDRVQQALAALRRGGETLVMMLDLDGFKDVNDTHGHAAGDRLLVAAAERMRASVRPGDVVCRFAGDEFVVVCHDTSGRGEARDVAQRIVAGVRQPVWIGERAITVGVSIGVATTTVPERTPEWLLREADQALYRAKHRRRGSIEVTEDYGDS